MGTSRSATTLKDTRALEGTREARPEPGVGGVCLEVLEGPGAGMRWTSDSPRSTIGACEACDLVLHDDTVSRFHCEVVSDAAGSRIRDLGSVNGVFVDGVRAMDAFLRSGSLIRLGHTVLRFQHAGTRVPVLRSRRTRFGHMVGRSSAMRMVFALLEKVAANDLPVLLEGETGTGKSLAAESIHVESGRKGGPFFLLDCSAIPANLLESELFGHVKGAFSDAVDRVGAFETADGGTLFLDEIGELPAALQAKLLTVLDKGAFRRVGSNQVRKVDVRLIAATHRDLRAEVNSGRFREDLYFRIAVLPIRMPALRERLEDLPDLTRSLLARSRLALSDEHIESLMTEPLLASLRAHAWPGNIRELGNYLERCLTFDLLVAFAADEDTATPANTAEAADEDTATPANTAEAADRTAPTDMRGVEIGACDDGIDTCDDELDACNDEIDPRGVVPGARGVAIDFDLPYRDARRQILQDFERRYIAELLRRHGGNVVRAAAAADIGREYCHRLIKAHRIERPDED